MSASRRNATVSHTTARQLLALWLSLSIAIAPMMPSIALAAASPQAGSAENLIRAAERAVGAVVKSARRSKDPNLAPSNAKSKQFWEALKKLNVAVDRVQRGRQLRDETFFTALNDATSAVQEAQVALQVSGAADPAVAGELAKVERAVIALYKSYSIQARRRDSNQPLTNAERQKIEEIKRKQQQVDAKLNELERKAGKNQAQIDAIKRMRTHTREIDRSRYDASGFFAAFFAITIIDGLIWGWGPWWGGGWGSIDINIDIDIDIGDYDWDSIDDDIDIGDLDLETDIDDGELDGMEDYLEEGDFELSDTEMDDLGMDQAFYDEGADTLDGDGFGGDDLGGGFGGDMDGEADLGGADVGGGGEFGGAELGGGDFGGGEELGDGDLGGGGDFGGGDFGGDDFGGDDFGGDDFGGDFDF